MTSPLALYDNRLLDAAPVASGTAAGDYNVLNLRDMRPFTWWKPDALPATVTVDCGAAETADYAAIYAHDLGSNGVTLEIRKSTDNFAANDVLVATVAPADDKPLLLLFNSASSRYWRLRLVNGTAPTLAIALLGNRLEFPVQGLQQEFDPIGNRAISQTNRSIGGHPLGRIVEYRQWQQSVTFEYVSWAWLRATWKPAVEAWLDQEPWLFSWNPDTYPKETYLVTMEESGWSAPHRSGSVANLSIFLAAALPQ